MSHRPSNQFRLDAAEQLFFARQLEHIDPRITQVIFPDNLGRAYIPQVPGIPEWASTYTYRQHVRTGQAKVIGDHGDDLPRADVYGREYPQIIKDIGMSYGYTNKEIRAAAAVGMDLDITRALSCRAGIETLLEDILALGLDSHNLDGLLTIDGVPVLTPVTKTGGGTSWANATSEEIAKDLEVMATATIEALNQAGGAQFRTFTVLLPVQQHSLIAHKKMGDGDSTTILRFVIASSPYIEAIEPWHYCKTAGVGNVTRAVIYPRNELVVGAVIPQDLMSHPPQPRNLEHIINMTMSTGGVVVRYPVALSYMDGI